MTDIAFSWPLADDAPDLSLSGADLLAEDGLWTAIVISLFTDRRVEAAELPPGHADRRGWWGDLLEEDDRIGSRLWLLRRERASAEVAARAAGYAEEALAWMVEDGVLTAVSASASWPDDELLRIEVEATTPDGRRQWSFDDALRAA